MKLFSLLSLLLFFACQAQQTTKPTPTLPYQKIEGQTMGIITYHITYADSNNYKPAIDSVLKIINGEVSTYVPTSSISRFNASENGIRIENNSTQQHFLENIKIAQEAHQKTAGAFDATVMPLVNYWGFGYTGKEAITAVDQMKVDSLLQYIGMEKVEVEPAAVSKAVAGIQLDFSASAKGYAIDEVGKLLESQGVENYMVEIGGEVRARGHNAEGNAWRMGINLPKEGANTNDLFAIIQLENQSIATSGNYRNYYTVNGITYSHTINPKTGLPERTLLLSASVITSECAYADAYATACMVLGLEGAKELIDTLENVEAYFIYSDENNQLQAFATEKIAEKIKPI